MLHKVSGLVLTFLKFKETSIIVDIYTDLLGRKSYLVSGVLKPKSTTRALYEPLTLLNLVVYDRPRVSLNRIKESSLKTAYQTIPLNYHKCNLVFFLTDFLKQVLQESDGDDQLFNFIESSLLVLDQLEYYQNFHLQFLLKISHYLGFGISDSGILRLEPKSNISQTLILDLLKEGYENSITIDRKQRADLLDIVLNFYRFQIDSFRPLKSLDVLKTIYA